MANATLLPIDFITAGISPTLSVTSKDEPEYLKGWVDSNLVVAANEVAGGGGLPTWWTKLSDEEQESYLEEHPNSKYADAAKSHIERRKAASVVAPLTPEQKSEGNRVVKFLKTKKQHLVIAAKAHALEWKHAGGAVSRLTTGKPLEDHHKEALTAVGTDLARLIMATASGGKSEVAKLLGEGLADLCKDTFIKVALGTAVGLNPSSHRTTSGYLMLTSRENKNSMESISKEQLERITEKTILLVLEELEKKFKEDTPKEVKKALEKTTNKALVVKAKIDMSEEVAGAGLCPECRKPMGTTLVGGHEMLVCYTDRITLPKPDGC